MSRSHRAGRVIGSVVTLLGVAAPALSASAATTAFHDRGTLVSTDAGRHSLNVRDTGGDSALRGHTVVLSVVSTTRIQRDGKAATLSALRAGDGIVASGRRAAHGRLVAAAIQATSPPRPDGPAAAVPGSCPSYYTPCTPTLPPATGGPALTITMSNYTFNPPVAVVPVGTLVTVHNTDSVAHTFSGNHLDSGDLGNGQSFTVEFTTPGTYRFYCAIHPFMTGVLDVR